MVGLFRFSQDPAENETGAAPIFWQEGQPANSVNNSAREMMAALARWHADTTAGLVAAGIGSGTLSLSTLQGLDTTRAFEVALQVDGGNPGPVQISVDGATARDVRRPDGAPLAPGDLRTGVVYRLRWVPGLGRYTVVSPHIDPAGMVVMFGSASAVPSGWVICDGRLLGRAAYAALFSAISTVHGATDSTNFRVPDLRGRAPFGADAMGGAAANRLTGAGGLGGDVGDVGGAQTITLSVAQMPAHDHDGTTAVAGGSAPGTTGTAGEHDHGGSTGDNGRHSHSGTSGNGGDHDHAASAAPAGGHAHIQYYTKLSGVQSGGGLVLMAVLANGPGDTYNAAGQNETVGGHVHTVDVDPAGPHQHPFTTDTVDPHAHSIAAVAPHAHSIPAVSPHSHALTTDSAGGGGAHANVPPGAVVVFAIKA